jgi:hypothetical protein
VSLLYPFLASVELDEQVIAALGELLLEQAPMPVTFATCYRRGGFVALRPDPLEGLVGLISTEVAAMIEQEASAALPIPAELQEAYLMVFEQRWALRGRFAFHGGL